MRMEKKDALVRYDLYVIHLCAIGGHEARDMYIPRVIDDTIKNALTAAGGVVIDGPRFCGKTTTAKQLCASSVELDKEPGLLSIAHLDPLEILRGETPRLIDEWQLSDTIWNAARHEIDERGKAGQFILTGSAVPRDDITRHSGAGRFVRIQMETMTLSEMGISSSSISLKGLFDGTAKKTAVNGPSVRDYVKILIRGGWPGLRETNDVGSRMILETYVDEISRVDINIPNGMSHDPMRVIALIRSLARNTANEFPNSRLAAESSDSGQPLSEQTVRNYLDALRRIHILKDQPAWNTHLRSRVRLIRNPKRHLVDPSIALAAIGATEEELLRDGNALGFFFESLVIHDLRALSSAIGGNVFHYRDSSGLEIDAIIELRNAKWGAIEVKMPEKDIDTAAKNLLALVKKLEDSVCERCMFLAVVTSGQASYTRPDGVRVISLGHIGA
jgi:predicted AAA+ superfamily ATPase